MCVDTWLPSSMFEVQLQGKYKHKALFHTIVAKVLP